MDFERISMGVQAEEGFCFKRKEQTCLTLHCDSSHCERRGVYGQGQGNNLHDSYILLWYKEEDNIQRQTFILFFPY